MLDVMFDLPSRDDIEKCVVTKDTVIKSDSIPKLHFKDGTVTEGKKHPKESA